MTASAGNESYLYTWECVWYCTRVLQTTVNLSMEVVLISSRAVAVLTGGVL